MSGSRHGDRGEKNEREGLKKRLQMLQMIHNHLHTDWHTSLPRGHDKHKSHALTSLWYTHVALVYTIMTVLLGDSTNRSLVY